MQSLSDSTLTWYLIFYYKQQSWNQSLQLIIFICFYTMWRHSAKILCCSSDITPDRHVVQYLLPTQNQQEPSLKCWEKAQFLANELNFDRVLHQDVNKMSTFPARWLGLNRANQKLKLYKSPIDQQRHHQPIVCLVEIWGNMPQWETLKPLTDRFHPVPGQGHAADGEVGGGDGPQTCHSSVNDWDRHTQAAAETTWIVL